MRVLVINDSDVLRYRIRTVVTEIPEIELIGETTDLRQAIDIIHRSLPDIVVVCFQRLSQPLLRTAANLRAINPETNIIVLTGVLSYDTQEVWRELGANFVFDLTMGLDLLIETLNEATSEKSRFGMFVNQRKSQSAFLNEGALQKEKHEQD